MFRVIVCLLVALCAVVPAFGGEKRCGISGSRLPDTWTVLSTPQTRDGLCIAVYGATNHTASVMMGLGEARGLSTGDLARDVAALINVQPEREEHLDSVRFWAHSAGVPVVCTVNSNVREFRFTCIFGDEAAAHKLF